MALDDGDGSKITLLKTEGLTKNFGGLTAIDDVSLEINKGEIVGLIGPNGSGKTTLFNVITGIYKPNRGRIYFDGQIINHLKPYERARLGMARVFQLSSVFKDMNLIENLQVVLESSGERKASEKALNFLEFVGLIDLKHELAGNLSYGQQRLLEFVRALSLQPKLLLLDEPTAGVNVVLKNKLLEYVASMRDEESKTFVIIEHSMSAIAQICDRVMVLDHGQKIAQGTPEEIQRDERVADAYLGGVSDAARTR